MARPLRLLVALALVALALAAAACGGDGGGEDLTAGLSPAQVLERSADAARELESFRLALEATGEIEGGLEGVPGGELLRGPFEVSGEGPVVPPDRASLDVRVTVGGLPLQVNLTRVGDGVFLGALGQDFRIAAPAGEVALVDFAALYPALVEWMDAPSEEGREEVGGAPTVRIAGPLDGDRAARGLEEIAGAPVAAEGVVEAWVGTEDLRPRRVRLRAEGGGDAVEGFSVDLRADLSAFDEPAEIAAPEGARTLSLDQLGSLLGG